MTTKAAPAVVHTAQAERQNVMGQDVRFRLTGAQTGGSFSLFEIRGTTGDGVPTHLHEREDESFHVLEGRIRLTVDGVDHELGPGDTAFGPRNVWHSWEALEPVRMLVLTTPAGMEAMFRELGSLPPQAGPAGAIEVCGRYGVPFA